MKIPANEIERHRRALEYGAAMELIKQAQVILADASIVHAGWSRRVERLLTGELWEWYRDHDLEIED